VAEIVEANLAEPRTAHRWLEAPVQEVRCVHRIARAVREDEIVLGHITDDATHESVAIVPERTIGGDHLTRILNGICSQRGKPAVIRSDGRAFKQTIREKGLCRVPARRDGCDLVALRRTTLWVYEGDARLTPRAPWPRTSQGAARAAGRR
jgi:hypothetical protein